MSDIPVQVFVQYEQEVPFMEALLRPYAVEVHGNYTTSGTISAAEASLLLFPERPVVIVLDATEVTQQPDAARLTVKRILARAYPENWYVGIAIPNLVGWAMTVPRFKRELESLPEKTDYIDRAARLSELIKEQPFDATELERTSADYRGLIEFVQKHAPAAAKSA